LYTAPDFISAASPFWSCSHLHGLFESSAGMRSTFGDGQPVLQWFAKDTFGGNARTG
jgi:hypothetical protein